MIKRSTCTVIQVCFANYNVIVTFENVEEIVEVAIGQFTIVLSLIDWLKSPSSSLEFYPRIVLLYSFLVESSRAG